MPLKTAADTRCYVSGTKCGMMSRDTTTPPQHEMPSVQRVNLQLAKTATRRVFVIRQSQHLPTLKTGDL